MGPTNSQEAWFELHWLVVNPKDTFSRSRKDTKNNITKQGPEVIKLLSSTQLSTKFQLLIKTKIPTNKEVHCFKSLSCCIYHTNKFVCFCCFTSHVNSYGHCGTVSSLNHTFSWAGLSKRLTSNLYTYFRL